MREPRRASPNDKVEFVGTEDYYRFALELFDWIYARHDKKASLSEIKAKFPDYAEHTRLPLRRLVDCGALIIVYGCDPGISFVGNHARYLAKCRSRADMKPREFTCESLIRNPFYNNTVLNVHAAMEARVRSSTVYQQTDE